MMYLWLLVIFSAGAIAFLFWICNELASAVHVLLDKVTEHYEWHKARGDREDA